MGLRLHNTLSRTKQDFVPIDPKNVRMYVCGPTVYDFAHIGNARPLIVFDVLFRLLRHLYGEQHVTYVRNITDVDDKINARAAEEYPDLPLNDAIRAVTEKTAAQFHADVDALGCLRPTHEPRATEYVMRSEAPTDMVRLIADLIARGHAYAAEGHVLFHVASMPDYGKLSNRSLDDMIAGARVEVAPYKRDPMDFVLWKPSKDGEPAWPSPWSNGRPGWHIECSAMAGALLGDTFDIHGGGIDLIFPHHENEIAQSRCAHGTEVMANYWLHNGFLQVEGEKMSKSLGNFVTIRELLAGIGRRPWPGEVVRTAMLATHYRQPIDFTEARLEFWRTKVAYWGDAFKLFGSTEFDFALHRGEADIYPSDEVVEALGDDLNSHGVFAFFDRLAPYAAKQDHRAADELGRNLIWLGIFRNRYSAAYQLNAEGGARLDLLGRFSDRIEDAKAIVLNEYEFSHDAQTRAASLARVQARLDSLDPTLARDGVRLVVNEHAVVSLEPLTASASVDHLEIERLISARAEARKAKNFAEADRIRAELDAMGVQLKDAKDPATGELKTTWELKR